MFNFIVATITVLLMLTTMLFLVRFILVVNVAMLLCPLRENDQNLIVPYLVLATRAYLVGDC